MIWVGRICIGFAFIFSVAIGLLALFAPERAADAVGLGLPDAMGLNTVRADIGAMFLTCAVATGGALFAGKRNWLWVPIILLCFAILGRTTGIVMAGAPDGVSAKLGVEIVLVAFLVTGLRFLRAR